MKSAAMKRSDRIGAIADLEQHESDAAARILAEGQRVLREREVVLTELRCYRDDYVNMGRLRSRSVSVIAFQDYQRFVARLDEAIAQQSQLVADAQTECDARRNAWVAARGRAMSLEKAVERCEEIERRSDARREQWRLDEAASRLPRTRGGNEPTH
jgi:flagellar FliJ protein